MIKRHLEDMRQKNFLEPYLSHWTRPRCLSFLVQCSRCPWAGVILTVPDNGNHALFLLRLDLFKRKPVHKGAAQCVLYEDAPANCAAARAAGMGTVGVYDAFYHDLQTELRQSCDRYIESFQELLEA